MGLALGGTGVAVAGSGSGTTTTTTADRSTRPGKIVRQDRQAFLDDVAKRAGIDAAKLRDAISNLRQTGIPGLRFGGPLGGLAAAADYLGLQPRDLLDQLRSKTLAQIAADRSKRVDGLKQALRDGARNALDRARSNGRITQQQEVDARKRLDDGLDDLVNGRNPEITALAKALNIDREKLANAIRDAKLAEVGRARPRIRRRARPRVRRARRLPERRAGSAPPRRRPRPRIPADEPGGLLQLSVHSSAVSPAASGSSTRKRAPAPGAVSTVARPPWASAIAATIASPRPAPPMSRERDGSAR